MMQKLKKITLSIFIPGILLFGSVFALTAQFSQTAGASSGFGYCGYGVRFGVDTSQKVVPGGSLKFALVVTKNQPCSAYPVTVMIWDQNVANSRLFVCVLPKGADQQTFNFPVFSCPSQFVIPSSYSQGSAMSLVAAVDYADVSQQMPSEIDWDSVSGKQVYTIPALGVNGGSLGLTKPCDPADDQCALHLYCEKNPATQGGPYWHTCRAAGQAGAACNTDYYSCDAEGSPQYSCVANYPNTTSGTCQKAGGSAPTTKPSNSTPTVTISPDPGSTAFKTGDTFTVIGSGFGTSDVLVVKIPGRPADNLNSAVSYSGTYTIDNSFTSPGQTAIAFSRLVNGQAANVTPASIPINVGTGTGTGIPSAATPSTGVPATSNPLTNPQVDCTGANPNPLYCLTNPLPVDNLQDMLLLLIRGFLALIGIWAVTFIIIGGFRLVMASGNEEQYAAAKKTIIWAILGLLAALLSFSLVAIVENFIGAKTVPVNPPQTAQQNTSTNTTK